MDDCYPLTRENPEASSNFLSKIFFAWMKPICYEGNTKGIELSSLYKTLEQDKSKKLTDDLQNIWDKEIELSKLGDRKPSLLRTITKAFLLRYFYWGLLMFFNMVVLRSVQPLALASLIQLFSKETYTVSEVVYSAGALCAISLVSTFLNHHSNVGVSSLGMRVRVSISSLIYRKILKLSQLSLSKTAAGQVVNLLSNDVARFDLVAYGLNFLWIGPIQVIIVSYLMWREVGPSSMAGVVSMLIMTLPIQLLLGSVTSRYRLQIAKKTDHRVRIMSELLSGIQVIKMYTWETPFEKVVEKARKDEVKYLTKTNYIRSILVSFMVFVERATLGATIISYVIMGNEISADVVFSLSMYFNLLQLSLAIIIPFAITQGAECLVSIKRLQDFLLMQEKETTKISSSEDNSIRLKHVEAFWEAPTTVLKNMNLIIPPGKLCAVVGPVGSGKSSFLKLLLGELAASNGSVHLSGEISYASQEPWLYASTVRNNILFGEEYNKLHYKTVVKVCALERDFEQFPERDKTKVGDKGVSLSGGQRARINLARAVYKDSDIYLLDDPLSAVDTKVGRHLFDQCIVNHLRGKTRILVTHQLQYLKKADMIIVLNRGVIEAQGTFDELSKSDLDFTKLLVAADETHEVELKNKGLSRQFSTVSISTTASFSMERTDEENAMENMENKSNFVGSPFRAYFKSIESFPLLVLLGFLLILGQVMLSSADYWITLWTDQQEMRHASQISNSSDQFEPLMNYEYIIDDKLTLPNSSDYFIQSFIDEITDNVYLNGEEHKLLTTDFLMYTYIFILIGAIVVVLMRSVLFYISCMRASKRLHNKMFHCLLEAPMRFFDTNPAGRVLNRFSKDMGTIDEQLPKALVDVTQIILVMVGILIMVTLANYFLIIVIIILGILFMIVRKWYVTTARSIKLIEGIAKSPVFSFVSSSIDGLTTIRATKNENILMKQFDEHQDVHSSAWYLTIMCTCSFGLWLDLICVIFVCTVVGGFVVLDQFTEIKGSFIGLGISQSLILVGMLQYGMRLVSEAVNYLTSVERVLEYTQLEREYPLLTPKDKQPPKKWPNSGEIIFKNLVLRYVSTDPPVLNNLSLEIQPSEKIGIVGRTGAGKSSLIAALFRLAPIEGHILIDDVDTKLIGLKDLRKVISIIPQEPVLFSATMRYNLDPFSEYNDEKLWESLEEVELKTEISSLDFMVTEGGGNLSVGQRQLICLARAILRNNRVLILDEATANVDPKTDELIQKTIRRKFRKCTVLTIAHRLNTIMDSDKVLVMDSGCKVEFDHPHILLQNPEGYFSKMLVETGPTMTQTLKTIAFEAYQQKMEISSTNL